ncbi:MAG: tetratricopeptide repeat protein [Bacteroidia bacterium]|nr:tetratricopeptide repeat protein [Bacteroidia bacterium]
MKIVLLFLLFPVLIFGQSPLKEADQLFEHKQFIKAEQLLSAYVDSNPDDLKAIERLGDAYGHQLKWNEAISQYRFLVRSDGNNANFHYKYGGALGMKALSISKIRAVGLIGDIKRAFLRAAELDPQHIDTRWALVELYIQLPGIIGGSKKKSLHYAQELEDLSKVDGYLAKGYIYEYDDEPDLAEKYYKLAIVEGGSITCFDKLTNFYENQNRPDNAITNLEAAYNRHNKNALHYQIGKVCADYNIQLEKGERCLKIYIQNHTARDGVPIEWAYYRLAQIYKNKKDRQEALKWIDKALEVRSDFEQAKKEKQKILSI